MLNDINLTLKRLFSGTTVYGLRNNWLYIYKVLPSVSDFRNKNVCCLRFSSFAGWLLNELGWLGHLVSLTFFGQADTRQKKWIIFYSISGSLQADVEISFPESAILLSDPGLTSAGSGKTIVCGSSITINLTVRTGAWNRTQSQLISTPQNLIN